MAKQTSDFDNALASYLAAQSELDALGDEYTNEAADSRTNALCDAERRVIEVPANSIEELRAKLELLLGNGDTLLSDAESLAILRDFHKLTDQPSRVFNAERWLAKYDRLGGGWIKSNGEIMLSRTLNNSNAERIEAHLQTLDRFNGMDAVRALIAERGAIDERRSTSGFSITVGASSHT